MLWPSSSSSLTVGLLVPGPGAGPAELLGLAAPGVGHKERPVELDKDVADLLLALLVNVCKWKEKRLSFDVWVLTKDKNRGEIGRRRPEAPRLVERQLGFHSLSWILRDTCLILLVKTA